MSDKPNMSKRAVADLVTQLARMTYGESFSSGLTPTQWTTLRYFFHANRFSQTMSAFAKFHATTRGTASQTIKGLVQSGYLKRKRSKTDGRSIHFNLTNKSKMILSDDPFEALVGAAGVLTKPECRTVARILEGMLCNLAQQRGIHRFGMCTNCKYFQKNNCDQKVKSIYICTLMDEPLEEAEIEQLCVNFQLG
jgi:DNA-binding MarR family transcriptional regulator